MKTGLLVYCLLAFAAFAQDSDSLYREERSLLAKLEKYPEQPLMPLPADSAMPYTEYFRYEDRLYKKLYTEGADGQAWVTEYLCTNESHNTWQEKEPVPADLKKTRDYIANERLQARIDIQNTRNQILIQISSLQRQQDRKKQEEIARQAASTESDVYDSQGRLVQRVVTRPGP